MITAQMFQNQSCDTDYAH